VSVKSSWLNCWLMRSTLEKTFHGDRLRPIAKNAEVVKNAQVCRREMLFRSSRVAVIFGRKCREFSVLCHRESVRRRRSALTICGARSRDCKLLNREKKGRRATRACLLRAKPVKSRPAPPRAIVSSTPPLFETVRLYLVTDGGGALRGRRRRERRDQK